MSKQFKSWDQYTEEANQEPFELPVSGEETILIQPVSGAGLIQFSRALRTNDLEAMLMIICGESWSRVEPLLAKAGIKAFENLLTDLMIYFDLAEEHTLIGQGGGKVREKDPRKIQAMIKQGYRFEGEANSRI